MSQKKKTPAVAPSKKTEEQKDAPSVAEKGKKLTEDLDKLMDEIDDVLEKNAEEFVKSYVQKGGE